MPGTSISGAWVVRKLDALVRVYGTPACIVSPAWDIAALGHCCEVPAGHWMAAQSSQAAES